MIDHLCTVLKVFFLKLKQNGLKNIWRHQASSAQWEANETRESFLFWFHLFHIKVFAQLGQCTQLDEWRMILLQESGAACTGCYWSNTILVLSADMMYEK